MNIREKSPGHMAWKISTLWEKAIKRALSSFELSYAAYMALLLVAKYEEKELNVTQNDITQKTGIDKMTISNTMRSLSRQGFIIREESPIDTRSKSVYLTHLGRAIIKKVTPLIENVDKEIFNSLSEEELLKFTIASTKLYKNAMEIKNADS